MWRKRKVEPVSVHERKLHGRMIQLLYGHRSGNVTPHGVPKVRRGA